VFRSSHSFLCKETIVYICRLLINRRSIASLWNKTLTSKTLVLIEELKLQLTQNHSSICKLEGNDEHFKLQGPQDNIHPKRSAPVLLGGLGKALNFCVQLSTTP
jgi:hypothetical protein